MMDHWLRDMLVAGKLAPVRNGWFASPPELDGYLDELLHRVRLYKMGVCTEPVDVHSGVVADSRWVLKAF